jgi:spermidine synthase
VANIGLGSGLTAHVLLGAPNIERVDTIEIEPAMIEAAHGFGTRVERVFQDARSHIYVDDAKTFFATHRSRYDIILSEPSNPWVSGVAGLFSDEFYRRVRTHLNPGGLFVQWLQLYEIDTPLLASVMKAMNRNFPDYAVYVTDAVDIIVVARADGRLMSPDFETVLAQPRLAEEMQKVNVVTAQDLNLRYLGDRALLEPLFATFAVAPNSDFFPVLDLNAARTRFMHSDAKELLRLQTAPLPVLEMLGSTERPANKTQATPNEIFELAHIVRAATQVRDVYLDGTLAPLLETTLDADLARHLVVIQQFARDCHARLARELWLDSVFHIASRTLQYLSLEETALLSKRWRVSDCHPRLSAAEKQSLALFQAVGQRNAKGMAEIAEHLLATSVRPSREQSVYLLGAGMLGYLAQRRSGDALRLWSTYGALTQTGDQPLSFMFRLLLAHSIRPDPKKQTREVVANKGS